MSLTGEVNPWNKFRHENEGCVSTQYALRLL